MENQNISKTHSILNRVVFTLFYAIYLLETYIHARRSSWEYNTGQPPLIDSIIWLGVIRILMVALIVLHFFSLNSKKSSIWLTIGYLFYMLGYYEAPYVIMDAFFHDLNLELQIRVYLSILSILTFISLIFLFLYWISIHTREREQDRERAWKYSFFYAKYIFLVFHWVVYIISFMWGWILPSSLKNILLLISDGMGLIGILLLLTSSRK